MTRRLSLIVAAVATTAAVQWLNYPAPGVPRPADVDYCRGGVVAPVLLPSSLACHSAAPPGLPQSRYSWTIHSPACVKMDLLPAGIVAFPSLIPA